VCKRHALKVSGRAQLFLNSCPTLSQLLPDSFSTLAQLFLNSFTSLSQLLPNSCPTLSQRGAHLFSILSYKVDNNHVLVCHCLREGDAHIMQQVRRRDLRSDRFEPGASFCNITPPIGLAYPHASNAPATRQQDSHTLRNSVHEIEGSSAGFGQVGPFHSSPLYLGTTPASPVVRESRFKTIL
jgi:hypothetical protein